MFTKLVKWTALVALAMPLAARADDARPPKAKATLTKSDAGKLSATDLQILAHLHQNDEMEVNAGKLAMQKATTPAIKGYGKMLIDDHGADARAIIALVQKQGQTLPDIKPVDKADKVDMQLANETMAKLNSLEGKDFDREFLRAQVAMHDKALAKLDLDIAKIKDNPALVQMLRGVRPVLEKHKTDARALLAADKPQA